MIISVGKFRFETRNDCPAGTRFAKWFDNLTGTLLYGNTGLVWQGHERKLILQYEPRERLVSGKTLFTVARPIVLFGDNNWSNWDTGILRRHYNDQLQAKNSKFPLVGSPVPSPEIENSKRR